jgi:hypothetical protein
MRHQFQNIIKINTDFCTSLKNKEVVIYNFNGDVCGEVFNSKFTYKIVYFLDDFLIDLLSRQNGRIALNKMVKVVSVTATSVLIFF